MTKCRKCRKEVNKYRTIYGYCFKCATKLGADIKKGVDNVRP